MAQKPEQRNGESSCGVRLFEPVDQALPKVSHTFGLFSYKSQ